MHYALIISTLILLSSGVQTFASITTHGLQSSNMRSVAVTFNTSHTRPHGHYDTQHMQTMEDFLELMVLQGMTDSSFFYNYVESREFKERPSPTLNDPLNSVKIAKIDPEILKFPRGHSIAVYQNPNEMPTSTTPLLWTRGLHKFQEFDAPYGGHIAFLDGHITYYSGKPNNHDPELLKIFNKDSFNASTIRILEHVPDDWTETAPLPVRYAEFTKVPLFARYSGLLAYTIPALIGGLLAIIFNRTASYFYQKIISGMKVFIIIYLLTALFFSMLLC